MWRTAASCNFLESYESFFSTSNYIVIPSVQAPHQAFTQKIKTSFPWKQQREPYSTGRGHCSTYTRINCMQYGVFPRKIHAKKLACKFLHKLFHANILHANLHVFTVTDFACKNTHKLHVFLYNSKYGWSHCGKTSFRGEKENNLQYTFSY